MDKFFSMPMFNPLSNKEEQMSLSYLHKWRTKDNKFQERTLEPNCISNSDQLNKALRLLKNRGWVDRQGNSKYYHYTLRPKFYTDQVIKSIVWELNSWAEDNVMVDFVYDMEMESIGLPNKPILVEKDVLWEICGIPSDMFDALSSKFFFQMFIPLSLSKTWMYHTNMISFCKSFMSIKMKRTKENPWKVQQCFKLCFFFATNPHTVSEHLIKSFLLG